MTAKEFSQNFGESTIKVIILGVVTFGIYFFIWIAERRKELNTLAEQEIFNNNITNCSSNM